MNSERQKLEKTYKWVLILKRGENLLQNTLSNKSCSANNLVVCLPISHFRRISLTLAESMKQ